MEITIGEFKDIGINEIDINLVVSKWSRLWGIYQWNDEYRIIKHKQKNSPITQIKLTISETRAHDVYDNNGSR